MLWVLTNTCFGSIQGWWYWFHMGRSTVVWSKGLLGFQILFLNVKLHMVVSHISFNDFKHLDLFFKFFLCFSQLSFQIFDLFIRFSFNLLLYFLNFFFQSLAFTSCYVDHHFLIFNLLFLFSLHSFCNFITVNHALV